METKINRFNEKIYNPWILQAGRMFFYLGLLFEVFILTLDRADWINPYQSLMFRITFVLFLIKCICTPYNKKEWLFIIITGLFSIICYKLCGKDEVVRAMVFIISMKNMDLKRTLKCNYILTSLGVFVLGLLAIFGVMGDIIASPGYASKANAFMLCFGLGSSNTWAIQIWVLIALMVYLYHDRFNLLSYGFLLGFGVVVFILSKTRTELIMIFFTCFLGVIIYKANKFRESKIFYLLGAFAVLFSTGFSIFAAKITKWWDFQPVWQRTLDIFLTGRITSLYAFENGGGALSNWRLFGADNFIEYFDMGIVRLFWWYGIIPGGLAILGVLYLIYFQYKKRDYMGLMLVVSIFVFSILEAHFISPFIIRNYLLFMAGDCLFKSLEVPKEKKSVAFYIGSLTKGGAERVFCNLAAYFVKEGYEVTMITQYKKEQEYELPEGVTRVISDITKEESKGRIYNFFARFYKLHNILVKTDADILLTTIGKNNFMAIACSIFVRTRVVVSIVADPKEEYNSKIMRVLLQLLFPEADGIVMQTTQSLKFLKLGLDKKAIILPNSIAEEFVMDRYEGKKNKDIYIIGRMDANKNHEMAIKAFANISDKYPDARLIIVGDGELRDYLKELTINLNINEKVEFTGYVSDVQDRIKKAYIFLLTSYTEGMPNTLLEAMAAGVACISTDCPCGGPADLITPNMDGILIPVGDVSALEKELDNLLSNEEFTTELGKNAYETLKNYRPDVVNKKWKQYFDAIIAS